MHARRRGGTRRRAALHDLEQLLHRVHRRLRRALGVHHAFRRLAQRAGRGRVAGGTNARAEQVKRVLAVHLGNGALQDASGHSRHSELHFDTFGNFRKKY